ncbi:hypothetical protein [Paenibacillus sp. Y412MC10]|uniref:hypothetical protein n=1 Tax=Geobacillus sp. (strain Y412MC10) TaxID=481743 RepID=UPI0011A70143|nr:hypothetical protein [Paenibacillus sp. Y412MC10]
MIVKKRHIRIGAENWINDPEQAHVDVVVTFPDATRWISNFYTIPCIESMRKDYLTSGACLNGAYWCASTPVIIVDTINRERIEQVVDDLIEKEGFPYVFEYFGPVEERDLESSDYPPDFFDKGSRMDPWYISWHAVRLKQMLDQADVDVRERLKEQLFGESS